MLTQNIDTTNAAFPVVADPKLTFGFGVYLNLWGGELNAIASAMTAVGGAALIVGCATSKLPVVLAKIVLFLCVTLGGPTVLQVLRATLSFWQHNWLPDTWCYQKLIVPNTGSYVRVAPHNNCQGA